MPTLSGRPSLMDAIIAGEKFSFTINNRDACFSKEPVRSVIDGSYHSNRAQYQEHLKRHGCVEVGNDVKIEPRKEVQGDFNVRKELAQATREVLSKNE